MNNLGMALIISVGKYGGFYKANGRLCLGWVAITFLRLDGDILIEVASKAPKETWDKVKEHYLNQKSGGK